MIYVTHDQIEALTLADRIAVMRDGEIQQVADPQTLCTQPVNSYVADFVGSTRINFLEGIIASEGDSMFFNSANLSIDLSRYQFAEDATPQPACLGMRPEHIYLVEQHQPGIVNVTTQVDIVRPTGANSLIWASMNGEEIRINQDSQVQYKQETHSLCILILGTRRCSPSNPSLACSL